jgi:DNA-binding LytR/AlgR family response regulator
MKTLRCILVEDEPVARDILRTYIGEVGHLELLGEFEDGIAALNYMNEHSVDLMFLDINMPRLSGISLIKSLAQPPIVIITTAYSEFALEGYDLNVADYLLKPFSFERFIKAINKVSAQNGQEKVLASVVIKADGKTYRVNEADILYIEGMGDYITVYTPSLKLTFNQSLKAFHKSLQSVDFVRVHKSYVVSLPHIDFVEGNQIQLGEKSIPIGNVYKAKFQEHFGQ